MESYLKFLNGVDKEQALYQELPCDKMAIIIEQDLAFVFGILGNIVSFMVFLAPMPTFYTIHKKKSSEGYQCIPYVVALFSATLLLYYAFLKKNAVMIVSINGIGIVIELSYITVYLIYAPKKLRISTLRLILLFNVGGQSIVMLFTSFYVKGSDRVSVVGWICAVFNLAVFAAPLSVMRQVIKTRSVEYMPFTLSLFLTLCATSWFFYGFFVKDFYIAVPNVMGFLFGIVQMILYFIYKDVQKNVTVNTKLQDDSTMNMQMSASAINQKEMELNVTV